jgi:hypothetical protein
MSKHVDQEDKKDCNPSGDVEVRRVSAAAGMALAGGALFGLPGALIGGLIGTFAGVTLIEEDEQDDK